jgi:hypothetical protein
MDLSQKHMQTCPGKFLQFHSFVHQGQTCSGRLKTNKQTKKPTYVQSTTVSLSPHIPTLPGQVPGIAPTPSPEYQFLHFNPIHPDLRLLELLASSIYSFLLFKN